MTIKKSAVPKTGKAQVKPEDKKKSAKKLVDAIKKVNTPVNELSLQDKLKQGIEGTIEIGDRVLDIFSGIEGIVTMKTSFVHGCDKILLQREGVTPLEGRAHPGLPFSVSRLKLLEKNVFPYVQDNDPVFKMGDKVKDKITGFEGVITGVTLSTESVRNYTVTPQTLKDGQTQDANSFDEPQLELVKEKTYEAPKAKKTGGQPYRVPRTRPLTSY